MTHVDVGIHIHYTSSIVLTVTNSAVHSYIQFVLGRRRLLNLLAVNFGGLAFAVLFGALGIIQRAGWELLDLDGFPRQHVRFAADAGGSKGVDGVGVCAQICRRDEDLQERKWCKFLTAVKNCAGQEKYDTPKKLYDAQITEDGALGEFFDELATFWQQETTPSKSPMRSCLKNKEPSGASSQEDEELSGQSSDSPARKKARFSYSDSLAVTHDSLVVCFDEVSALQDCALRALCRAAKHMGVLAIFSDTAASICKVMKPNDHRWSTTKASLLVCCSV